MLERVDRGAYTHLALASELRSVEADSSIAASVTALVSGTVRARGSEDWLLARVLDRPIPRLEPSVRSALRAGVFELLDGEAPHAVVNEWVGLVPERARGFTNAVLRSVAALGSPWLGPDGQPLGFGTADDGPRAYAAEPGADDDAVAAVHLSYPQWIVARLDADLGRRDARAALTAMNCPPAVTLRVNRRRATTRTVADALAEDRPGVVVEAGTLVPGALVVRGAGDLGATRVLREGWATPQDQASQAVAAAVAAGAPPGESVLEVGAAPGGKSTAIGETVGEGGIVIALDVHPGRVGLVVAAARRVGLTSVHPVVADGHALPLRDGGVDHVLVDAPCSGLGVLRRRADARWRVSAADVADLAGRQRALVRAGAAAVRPGGTLTYSVCTMTAAETLDLDEWFAASSVGSDFEAIDPGVPVAGPGIPEPAPEAVPWRPWGRGALVLPQDAGTDGMFLLRLRRRR